MGRLRYTREGDRVEGAAGFRQWRRRLTGTTVVMGLVLLAIPLGAQAATLAVTRTDDPASASCTPANCTLRAAVALADSDGGNDTIELPAGTYQLTSVAGGALVITANMTIVGAGARTTTITPEPSSQIFKVEGGNVALDDLTLTGAAVSAEGGAVEVGGKAALTLQRDTLSDNDVLVKTNYSGGAVYDASTGPLLIEASTFSANSGYNGGALSSQPPTTIVNSTFTGNHAGSPTFNGDGGAMDLSQGVLVNDTITGNECFNGAGCGGGIIGTMSAADTIIAGNTSNSGTLTNCASTVTITGPDLEDGTDCDFTTDGSKRGNPQLGPLADNGGPTDTELPGAGSPAIDNGTNATCASHDQRGGARPAPGGGSCDIGAVEVNSLADLSIAGTVSPTSVLPGGAVVYTLKVTNNGPDPALQTSVQNLLPAGATFAGAITTTGSCTGTTVLTCTLGTLASGVSATIDISATLSVLGTATDIASVSAPATDPTPANNQTSITSSVLAVTPPPATPAPTLTAVSQTHSSWREGSGLATFSRAKHKAPPIGTTFALTLNTPAQVHLTFAQSLAGRKVKGKCVSQTPKNRHQRTCNRSVNRGALSFAGHSGANKVSFQGRLSSSQKLPPGRYTVVLVATNSAGQSATRALSFTIAR